MKGYISLLKGAKLKKNKNLNSLFIFKKPNETKESENTENLNNLPNIKELKMLENIKNITKEPKNMIKLFKRKSRISRILEDYEDLFFYLLKTVQKIELFELNESIKNRTKRTNISKTNNDTYESESDNDFIKESNNIDLNTIFYNRIFLGLIEKGKQYWENFYFPKAIYKIIYKKSREKQKEILSFSIKYNMKYDTVINSYEKIYTNKIQKKNWDIDPITSYNNYMEIYNKNENLIKGKEENNLNDNKKMYLEYENRIKFNKDIVVKTNNKGNGKTLIFNGKLLNIYVDDFLRRNNESHLISINSPTQKKKEIIYNSKNLLPKLKQSFSFGKNISSNKNKPNIILTQKSNKNIKTNLMNITENKKEESENNFNKRLFTHSTLYDKKKPKNKRHQKSIRDIINEELNMNMKMKKYSLSPVFSNKNINSINSINTKGNSQNLILGKLVNKTKKTKRNLFTMFKFSYY